MSHSPNASDSDSDMKLLSGEVGDWLPSFCTAAGWRSPWRSELVDLENSAPKSGVAASAFVDLVKGDPNLHTTKKRSGYALNCIPM